jgi:hypothetical protein
MTDTSDINTNTSDIEEQKHDQNQEKLEDQMKKDYIYPDPSDPEFQYKIYNKREFYYHKIPERPKLNDYADIKEYRDNICGRSYTLHEHQAMLSNFINPNTPYRGLLVFHGLGSGKCVLGDQIVTVDDKKMMIQDVWELYKTKIVIDLEDGEWSKPSEKLTTKSMLNSGFGMKKVVNLYREKVDNITINHVILDNGSSVKVTQIHKLLTDYGWTNEYKVDDLVRIDGVSEYALIKEIKQEQFTGYVYDLEIEDTHNYFVNNILCHNTCAGISIAEQFKSMVQKYGTKIYVLVSGPLIKENWKKELLQCTGETYMKYMDKSVYIDKAEEARLKKNAMNLALQYYRFMSYRSFYKRVLGEKIVDRKVQKGEKVRVSYRKTDEGEFERDIAVDRIYNLNNSIIVIDEAHNLTGNAYGEALKYIIKNSINLRIVLLTATPMKNLADDIVELLNFIRPQDAQIEREKIFTTDKIHLMEIKDGGLEYFKNMARGYVSHVRGADPLTFAKREDKGVIPEGLLFTKVIKCKMSKFQRTVYDIAVKEVQEDSLDRKSEAVANFVFPAFDANRKELVGLYGREGLVQVKNQLKTNYEQLNKKIAQELTQDKDETDLFSVTEDNKTVTGKIFQGKNLKIFSTKFYRALRKLNRLVWGKKGPKTAFVYSNLVKVGIELFEEVLIQNGYLEYQDNAANYRLKNNTVCYYCGKTYKEHNTDKDKEKDKKDKQDKERSESSTDYAPYKQYVNQVAPAHEFAPATFISVTGKSSEESAEYIPEDKKNLIDNVFNSIDNKEGKHIKLILGSKVMNEGISLRHVSEVHILDVYFNLGKVDQTVGRAIRYCSHYKIMSEQNQFPYVNVYKYVVSIENGLSTEEELYKKAEAKYLLIKKVERVMKEIAIDCPLNTYGNMFQEEIEKYKNCNESGHEPCPTICDFTKCDYKCDDFKLNGEYYDPSRRIYKKIPKDKLDTTTFTNSLARSEIEYSKKRIKELYMRKYLYTLENILEYVKETYNEEKRDLFDEFFVFKALDELIPITENDFNNFKDTILDKYNQQGYLIYRNKYYIFQPFDQNEDVPMYYRTSFDKELTQSLSLYNYLKNMDKYSDYKTDKGPLDLSEDDKAFSSEIEKEEMTSVYDFDSNMDYYDNRPEYKYVGIIDKEVSRRKSEKVEELKDVFKLREKRAKVLEKKRGTGIPSIKGAVCYSAKNKNYLEKVADELKLQYASEDTRIDLCERIKTRMIELEKYSTGKDKMTYIMVPKNHNEYPFPLNLEDRVEYIQTNLREIIKIKFDMKVATKTNKSNNKPYYEIVIKNDPKLKDYEKDLIKVGGKLEDKQWIITIN